MCGAWTLLRLLPPLPPPPLPPPFPSPSSFSVLLLRLLVASSKSRLTLLECRGRNSKIALAIGIALASYIYSLEGSTTWQYAAYASSSFSQHSLLGAIATAQAIILAVTKPFSAKFADVFGRAEALTMSVSFYCVGFIIIAACNNVHAYAAGSVVYYVRPLLSPVRVRTPV